MSIPMAETAMNDAIELHPMRFQEPLRTWAGHGTGAVCNGCGLKIQAHEIEYEIETRRDTPVMTPASELPTVPTLHFHFVCYTRWTGRGIR